jgi:anti-sigma B factor antagonist
MTWRADLDSVNETAILRLHGDLDLLVEPQLRQALTDACADYRHVLLDLSNVRLIDSTGLGLLVRAHQSAKRKDGVVCLLSPSRFILTVLHTMRLHPVFPVFPDATMAINWLAHMAAPRSPATGEAGDRGALGRA